MRKRLGELRVDFLIAGTQKGGTSALDSYLREHPQLCMADTKELHFFDSERLFARGRPDYSRYHRFFSPASPELLLGEATPIYMYWPEAPRRIKEYNPQMKLILTLRNPIERAHSHWNMEFLRNHESLCFWDALQMEAKRLQEPLSERTRLFSYLDRGFYSRQLARIWRYFPQEQTLVLRHDQLKNDPGSALAGVCNFLGIAPFSCVQPRSVNSTPYLAGMSQFERHYLGNIFAPEIRRLEEMLGWDCRQWLEWS